MLLRKLVVWRLLQAVPLLLVICPSRWLVSLVPGSVATALLGVSGTPAEYALIERQLGLNKPVYVQYWRWLDHVFHGSLGVSLENHQSVAAVLNSRIGVTVTLIVATVVVAIVGVSLGVVAAVHKGVVGRIVDGLSWLGVWASPTSGWGFYLFSPRARRADQYCLSLGLELYKSSLPSSCRSHSA